MTATITEARDQILGAFNDAWGAGPPSAGIPVLWWDLEGDANRPPQAPNPWARVRVQHNPTGGQSTLQNEVGNRRFTRRGTVTVQIFTPRADGLALAEQLAIIARDAFEGVTTSGGVIFRDPNIVEVGPDGKWFQTNVVADFEYDEIK